MSRVKQHPLLGLSLLLITALSVACAPEGSPKVIEAGDHTFEVDPIFREFHNLVGGTKTLGPAISAPFPEDGLTKQFFLAGLMVFNPSAPPGQQLRLAPLGASLGYGDPPVPAPQEQDAPYHNGHLIYADFMPLFEQLGGIRFVGNPLTEVKLNIEKNRLEQHFENLGFYKRLDMEGEAAVGLLSYGVLVCDFPCRYQPPGHAIIEKASALSAPFAGAAERMGRNFSGELLAGPFLMDDGSVEVVFENLVLYTLSTDPQNALVRPIVEEIGFTPKPLVPPLDDPQVIFFPVEAGLGYNIPVEFNDYIEQHGGLIVSGPPISNLFMYEETILRQCFTNICLDYDLSAADGQRLRPSALGNLYQSHAEPQLVEPLISGEWPQIVLKIWEREALISSETPQTIYVSTFDRSTPISNLEPTLTVSLPEAQQYIYLMPPTNAEGLSQITVPPVAAQNGTLIAYEVCVEAASGQRLCTKESYAIWGNAPTPED